MADEATETHNGDPFAPGSLGELVPDLWFDPEAWPDYEPEAPLSADEALERYLDWCADRGMELWDHQEEALLDLAAGDHVILGTPTACATWPSASTSAPTTPPPSRRSSPRSSLTSWTHLARTTWA